MKGKTASECIEAITSLWKVKSQPRAARRPYAKAHVKSVLWLLSFSWWYSVTPTFSLQWIRTINYFVWGLQLNQAVIRITFGTEESNSFIALAHEDFIMELTLPRCQKSPQQEELSSGGCKEHMYVHAGRAWVSLSLKGLLKRLEKTSGTRGTRRYETAMQWQSQSLPWKWGWEEELGSYSPDSSTSVPTNTATNNPLMCECLEDNTEMSNCHERFVNIMSK